MSAVTETALEDLSFERGDENGGWPRRAPAPRAHSGGISPPPFASERRGTGSLARRPQLRTPALPFVARVESTSLARSRASRRERSFCFVARRESSGRSSSRVRRSLFSSLLSVESHDRPARRLARARGGGGGGGGAARSLRAREQASFCSAGHNDEQKMLSQVGGTVRLGFLTIGRGFVLFCF